MAQTLYNLSCFLIGGDRYFKVEIDPAKEVANLKSAIKAQKPLALKDIEADQLTLYKIDVDATDQNTYITIVQDISQDLSNTEKATELNDAHDLSEVFETMHLPKRRIHILVICARTYPVASA